ncbi:Ig domain-containing protein [Cronobacter malonaticus]|uniref:Ig domain-containing protein n=1 Tax=Cronobacter malonaticus TaxID=413503 RepID=UPI001F407897|nr:Ig domain-containing protein [Cronobacter malonaticus]
MTPAAGALPSGTVGTALSQTFAVNGGAAPYRWQLSGSLPAGLTFSGGLLKGTPGVAGDSAFTLSATDANGVTVHAAYTLHINAAAAQAWIRARRSLPGALPACRSRAVPPAARSPARVCWPPRINVRARPASSRWVAITN